jgi:hypothetical protein
MLCKQVFGLSTEAVDNCVENLSSNCKKALWNAGLSYGPKKWAENYSFNINELTNSCWMLVVSHLEYRCQA